MYSHTVHEIANGNKIKLTKTAAGMIIIILHGNVNSYSIT